MKNEGVYNRIKKYSALIEITVGILGLVFLIYTLRKMLLLNETTFPHDHIYWGYPVFQFFTENIVNGHLPLWNPFTHGGEPFYPILIHLRLLEPITLLTIYLGKFFTNDAVALYNWTHFIQNLVMVLGVYCIFRTLAENIFIRISLIPILLFASFMLGPFRQAGAIYQFVWVPFIIFFLLRVTYYKDYRWHNWLILAGLIGVNWQSYYFSGPWIFLFFFSMGLIFFRRDILKELFKSRRIFLKFAVSSVIILTMSLPNVVLMLEKNKYIYPARMVEADSADRDFSQHPLQYEATSLPKDLDSIIMPYRLVVQTGAFSSIWDFIQIISPDGNPFIQDTSNTNKWGNPSEAYIYIGLFPWALAILGFIAGRHDLKNVWMLIAFGFALLIMGPAGGVHRGLYYLYPPLWFVRNMHALLFFFIFAFLYFYVLGFNYIFSIWKGYLFSLDNNKEGILKRLSDKKLKVKNIHSVIAVILFTCSIVGLVYWMTKLNYPESNYLFLLLAFCFIIGWVLRNDLGKKGIYAATISSHIIIVLIFHSEPAAFIIKLILLLGLPAGLFFLVRKKKRFYSGPVLLLFFTAILIWDLTGHLNMAAYLYEGQKHPKAAFNLDTTIHKPGLTQNRKIVPDSHYGTGFLNQSIRYLSLAEHQPYVFSPIMKETAPQLEYFEITSNLLKNKSFEEQIKTPDGLLIQGDYTYHQDGADGIAKIYELGNGVKEGNYSLMLAPSSFGNSLFRFNMKNIEKFKDHSIKVSIWVKSANKTPDAVQVDLQDGKGSVSVSSYSNSGGWENIEVVKHINKNANVLLLTFNVKHTATSDAWFDGIKIYAAKGLGEFKNALYARRWNSFSLLRNYYTLINSGIPPLAMQEMFAVGKPMFQFKQGAIGVQEDEIYLLLKKLGSEKAVKLLDNHIFVTNNEASSTSNQFITSFTEYQKSFRGGYVTKAINVQDSDFNYSIRTYNHNSLSVEVSSGKDGVLYWSDGYDKNWHAYINDKEVPVYRANVNFKAIHLPEGLSQVRFVYKHPLFKLSLFVFYGAFFLSITLALIARFNSENKSFSGN